MASKEEIEGKLKEIAANIEKVYNQAQAISVAAGNMYNSIANQSFPALSDVGKYWNGGTAGRYMTKTSGKLNEAVQDCVDIRNLANDIINEYLNYAEQQIKALGVNPHEVMPDIF